MKLKAALLGCTIYRLSLACMDECEERRDLPIRIVEVNGRSSDGLADPVMCECAVAKYVPMS